ncbi:hypothetical protein ACQPXB_44195 [Amycolatopsis sp. CA-161197]|uniref:hypothetical protein n=1 Tax=Amycolatopsis sp. CA-161197 TaxID=3239922 RepID=UPI003D92062D
MAYPERVLVTKPAARICWLARASAIPLASRRDVNAISSGPRAVNASPATLRLS